MYEAQVRCQHSLHTIRLDEGRLVLCDHKESADMLVAAADSAQIAGHNTIRCGEVIKAWREGALSRLPRAFRDPCSQSLARARARQEARVEPVERTPHEKLVARTKAAAMFTLRNLRYRRTQSRWVGGDHEIQVFIAEPGQRVRAEGRSKKVWDKKARSGTNSYLHVWLRRDWIFQVWRAGLAAIEGIFVLDVEREERDGSLLVKAARQGRGFEVRAEPAVVRERNGELKLAWSR